MNLNRIPKDGLSYHIVWMYNGRWWGESIKWAERRNGYGYYTDDGYCYDMWGIEKNESKYYIIGIETGSIINNHDHGD